MAYRQLDRDSIPEYLASVSSLRTILPDSNNIEIDEIGDGNLNFVYRITDKTNDKNSLILKQAVPFLRMAGESWPLSRNRMTFEIRALVEYNKLVPNYSPKIYHADEEMSVLAMENLSSHDVVRGQMIKGVTFPNIGKDIGNFLAQTLFKTSAFCMATEERRELMSKFVLNDELCKLTEEFIFTFPYIKHDSNYVNERTEKFADEFIRSDSKLKSKVFWLKEGFLTKADALLHADLHTGSIMANQYETYVIDTEFAYFGPIGFDVGKIIANFLMCATSHYFHSKGDLEYQSWLIEQALIIWDTFEERFLELWGEAPESAMYYPNFFSEEEFDAFKVEYLQKTFSDTVGYAACSIMRRTLGIAGVHDIRGIEDSQIRSDLEITNLKLAKALISLNTSSLSAEDLKLEIEKFYKNTKFKWS